MELKILSPIVYSIKEGVETKNLDPFLGSVIHSLGYLWKAVFPADPDGLSITSGHEGKAGDGIHMSSSKHYIQNNPTGQGRAIDLRTRDIEKKDASAKFVPMAKLMLGKDFDVVLEKDHIHIEFDPNGVV